MVRLQKIRLVVFFLLFGILIGSAAEIQYDSLPVKIVLFPFREAILSTQIDGMISKYHFRGGERFKKDDVLLTLDDQKNKNELQRVDSLMKEAALSAVYTKQKLEDNKRLYKSDLTSEIEVMKSELEANVAQERYRTTQIALAAAALQLKFCTVKAPFDGTVEKLLTREFETVRSGQPLISILDDNQLLAVMNLPTSVLPKVKIGLPVTFKINENSKIVTGEIYEIAARADHRSETFEIKVKIDNREHLFSAGMSGTLLKIGGANGN